MCPLNRMVAILSEVIVLTDTFHTGFLCILILWMLCFKLVSFKVSKTKYLKFEVHWFSLVCALGRKRGRIMKSHDVQAPDLLIEMTTFKLFQMYLKMKILSNK